MGYAITLNTAAVSQDRRRIGAKRETDKANIQ
jgi:hypothetical protein